MANLLETIVARKLTSSNALTSKEIHHLVITTVTAALEMAINAVENTTDFEISPRGIRWHIEPERIINEIDNDFTENVQQYWSASDNNVPSGETTNPVEQPD